LTSHLIGYDLFSNSTGERSSNFPWKASYFSKWNGSFQYNLLNQLIEETLIDGTTITYEYDSVGNRTKKIVTDGNGSTTTTYTYDAANQLTSVNGQSYTYDQNGNLTHDGTYTYVYNEDNRLIEVKDSGNTTVSSFTYDHQGRRTSLTTSSGTVYFYYDGDHVVYETDSNNNIFVEYTWDEEGNPVSMTKNGNLYYYHLNGHGDVVALTDQNGQIVANTNTVHGEIYYHKVERWHPKTLTVMQAIVMMKQRVYTT
jgi:YD repeat-containing protein